MDKETYKPLTGRSSAALKEELHGLPTEEKGPAFERALAELYRGNGWIVEVQGGRGDEGADILLSHPKTPHTVSLIVQAKNHNRPLTLDQTRSELIKFEQQAAERYKCQQFRLVAVNMEEHGGSGLLSCHYYCNCHWDTDQFIDSRH